MDVEDDNDAFPQDLLMLDFSPMSIRRRSRPTPAKSSITTGQVSSPQDDPGDETEVEEEVDEKDVVEDGQWSDFSHEPLEVDVVDEKSCIERDECWESDVWTGLPYVRIRKEMGVMSNGVMMDDQRVMMVLVRPLIVYFTCAQLSNV